MEPLRIAFLGASDRTTYLYTRLLDAMDDVELVGVWSRTDSSAKTLGDRLGVPWFTDMASLKDKTGAEAGVVSVSYDANGQVGLLAVQNGFHILTETPIAHDLTEADAIIETAQAAGLHVEVAEQFHRRPDEQIKRALIDAGVFGRVYSSFNDFVGHGYHGVSVMRSYLGFDAKPIRVVGSVHEYELASHTSLLSDATRARTETQEHGIVEFEGGQVGIFHWTGVGYDSAMRWWRGSRFYGERGMGVMHGTFNDPIHQLSIIGPDQQNPHYITLTRDLERLDGGALVRLVASTGLPDLPTVEWRNPFGQRPRGENPEWHDDEIGVALCVRSLVDAIRDDRAPSYGALQARLDQEIILAINQSATNRNQPVDLPLPR